MTTPSDRAPKTLDDKDIVTRRSLGRRTFMGILAAGAATAALTPSQAAAADADNGTWEDLGSCPRGEGGFFTNETDADDGNWADDGGEGRGAPYC